MAKELEKGDKVITTEHISSWHGVHKGDEGVVVEAGGWGRGPTVDFGDGTVIDVDEDKLAKVSKASADASGGCLMVILGAAAAAVVGVAVRR